MRRPAWLTCDLRPLGHPIWWSALAVLAVNDHLLKGAAVLPGWLTGKLSDFAFLIVAPVLLAALLPAVLRPRRIIALAGTAGLFAAAKVSPLVSAALVSALHRVGIEWRLWTDPTDLVALAVVPLSIALMRAAARPGRRRRRPFEHAGVLLGALACLATSAPPRFHHGAFLLNATGRPVSVNVTWLLRRIPCANIPEEEAIDAPSPVPADLPASLAATLTPGDLDDALGFELARGQVAALDGVPPPETSPAGTCSTRAAFSVEATCVGAILDAPPAAPVLMVSPAEWDERQWDSLSCGSASPASRCQPSLDLPLHPEPDAVALKEVGGALQFVAGAKVRLAPVDLAAIAGRASAPGNCRALREQYASLLEVQPCAADADCVAVPNLPIPGVAAGCGVDVTWAGARAVAALGAAWDEACAAVPVSDCDIPQPAVCRAGLCAPACPGEQVPVCLQECDDVNARAGGSCPENGISCRRADGMVCACTDFTVACRPAQPVSATCPLFCNDRPGGGTYTGGQIVHPAWDAGAPADAAAGD